MPLSWNEICNRVHEFSKRWEYETSEDAEALTMPPALVKTHQMLDRAVDACYRKTAFTSDAQRVEFLFERYQQLTSLLPTEKIVAANR